jgi:hypothetical protein
MRFTTEESASSQEVNCKQDTLSHRVVRFSLAVDSPNYLLCEDELVCEDDIQTLSSSGLEVDYAIV